MRDDLEMPAGKLASQAVHAGRLSLLHFLKNNLHRIDEFIDANVCGSVVTVRAKKLAALQRAFAQAKEAGLPAAMFTDSGHVLLPHFDGSPVISALAIGPAPRETIRPITKKFQIVK